MKKKITVLLSVLLLVLVFFPVMVLADDNQIEGKVTIFGEESPYPFSFNFDCLTTGDNRSYSKELSIFASLASEEVSTSLIEHQIYVTTNNSIELQGSFLRQMGFENVQCYFLFDKYKYRLKDNENYPRDFSYLNNFNLEEDQRDTAKFYIGYKDITTKGKKYRVFAVAIADTYGRGDLWESNFDIGADTETYYSETGSHPQWLNHLHAKGFDVAANRVYACIQQYIKENSVVGDNIKKNILITGYSRGGGLANLIGKRFEDDYNYQKSRIRPYTYTYAASAATEASEHVARSYHTIFNIVNGDDLVPNVSPKGICEWDFKRYGTDIVVDISKDQNLVNEWNEKIAVIADAETETNTNYLRITQKDIKEFIDYICRFVKERQGRQMLRSWIENKKIEIPEELQNLCNDINTRNTQYVSAGGQEPAMLLGSLIPSREALYEKTIATKMPEDLMTVIQENGFLPYVDIGKKDETGLIELKVCPTFFFKCIFRYMDTKGINFIEILANGLYYEASGTYLTTLLRAAAVPELINGVFCCHMAETYYFLANKIEDSFIAMPEKHCQIKETIETAVRSVYEKTMTAQLSKGVNVIRKTIIKIGVKIPNLDFINN